MSQRDNTLIISDAQEEDQGYYQCEGLVEGVPIENIFVYVEIESKHTLHGEEHWFMSSRIQKRNRCVKSLYQS